MAKNKHACSRIGKLLEGPIRSSIRDLVRSKDLGGKLTLEDAELIVGNVIETIEDELCS